MLTIESGDKAMRGPSFRKLIRSLRTRSYEKLEIFGYSTPIEQRTEGATHRVSSGQQLDLGFESHGQVDRHQDVVRNSRRVTDGKA